MDTISIDFFTIVVAALLNLIIGFVWYSDWLFGPVYRKLLDRKVERGVRFLQVIYAAMVSLVIAYFLAFFQAFLSITSVTDAMFVGFCIWLGFVVTTQLAPVIWWKGSSRRFWIDTGYKLLSILVMSGVIGA